MIPYFSMHLIIVAYENGKRELKLSTLFHIQTTNRLQFWTRKEYVGR